MSHCLVRFGKSKHAPVSLPAHANLSEHLTVQNSPVLFGCRTGICGTCIVHVEGDIPPPGDEELDTLDACAPGEKGMRLACQLDLAADILVTVPE